MVKSSPSKVLKITFSQLEKSDERIIALEAQVKIVNIEKKRVEEECQKLRDENGLFRDRLQEVAKLQNSPSASQYMTQEIEALASQVEELTSELIQERNRNNSLEKSLQGPPKVDFTTQTDEKGDLPTLYQTLKISLGINIVELRSKNERLEKENDSLRAYIDSIDEKSARKLRDITAESEQKVYNL